MKKTKKKDQSEEIEELEQVPEVVEGMKKGKKAGIIILAIFFAIMAVGFGARAWLGREEVIEEYVIEIGKDEGEILRKYALYNLRAQILFDYSFREMSEEEMIEKLNELRDGFAAVQRSLKQATGEGRGMNDMADIIDSDAAQFLTVVRNLRQVMVKEGVSEADKQAEFMRVVEENREKFRSAVYVSRYAFRGDEGEVVTKSGVIAEGRILAEVGGGVMNVFVGDDATGVVGVSSEDYAEGEESVGVRTLRSAHELWVTRTGEMFEIGTGVKDEFEPGKGVGISVVPTECRGGVCAEKRVTVVRRKIGLVGRGLFGVAEKFEEAGLSGFVLGEREVKTGRAAIEEVIENLSGKS